MTEIEKVKFRIKTWRDEIAERERHIRLANKWLEDNPPTSISEATKNIKNKVKTGENSEI